MNYCTYFLFATRQNFGEDDNRPSRNRCRRRCV